MGPTRVLLLGLPSHHPKVPEEMRDLVAEQLKTLPPQFAEAGMEYKLIPVTPEEDLAALGPKLQSYNPDCVVFGNGVRVQMDLTPFMEQLIEVVRTNAPQAKLAFNTLPNNTMDSVKRMFPTGQVKWDPNVFQ